MVLFCIIRNHCYLYLLCVMVLKYHLALSMPLIFIFGSWSLVGLMRFGLLFGGLPSLVWSLVFKESVVCNGYADADILIADLCVCGVWEPQTEALFYIRVVVTDGWPYHIRSPVMFWVPLRLKRSTNIYGLVRIDVPH